MQIPIFQTIRCMKIDSGECREYSVWLIIKKPWEVRSVARWSSTMHNQIIVFTESRTWSTILLKTNSQVN